MKWWHYAWLFVGGFVVAVAGTFVGIRLFCWWLSIQAPL